MVKLIILPQIKTKQINPAMTRFCLLAMLLLITAAAWAQPAKHRFMLSANGNYYKNTDTSREPQNFQKTKDKSLGLGFSAEYFVGERFSLGVGLSHYWDESEHMSHILANDRRDITLLHAESNYWMPKVFAKYYVPLVKRLYLVPHLSAAYGKPKIEAFYITSAMQYTLTDGQSTIEPWEGTTYTEFIVKPNHLTVEAAPELAYFFARHWGVTAYLGGLRYDRLSGDETASDWTFSFKPKYWRLGVNFNF